MVRSNPCGPGIGPDLALVDDDQGAIAIILDLVDPPLPGWGSGTGFGISSLMKPSEVLEAL
jgi:hypothetical protein